MSAAPAELDFLSNELRKKGVAGFSATTLSAGRNDLRATVGRLGAWIRSGSARGAVPLGIHLEGPFINPHAAGAHPSGILRKLSMLELEDLWEHSKHTLQILTLAPETLDDALLRELGRWARKRKVRLSIGHTKCTKAEAEVAFKSGFSGVTHAWNALSYHHREPGVLGAAFGREKTYIELIPDEVHVEAKIIDWTLALHPDGTFFVSDAAPAACTDGTHLHAFGDLRCRMREGASRLENGALAGGGFLLPESFRTWITREAKRKGVGVERVLKSHLSRIQEIPLNAIFMGKPAQRALLQRFPVEWEITASGALKLGIKSNP